MKASSLIGKMVTRTAPAECPLYKDRSFMGDMLEIVNADNDIIAFKVMEGSMADGKVRYLGEMFCDDNWKDLTEFLETVTAPGSD